MSKHECKGMDANDQLLFDVHVTDKLTLVNVPKKEILRAVNIGVSLGLAEVALLSNNVIDTQKLNLYAKLYLMNISDKLNGWLVEYAKFMSMPVRSQGELNRLIDEYNSIIMGSDPKQIDKALYNKANECASKLQMLHV